MSAFPLIPAYREAFSRAAPCSIFEIFLLTKPAVEPRTEHGSRKNSLTRFCAPRILKFRDAPFSKAIAVFYFWLANFASTITVTLFFASELVNQ
jgi:hypothetical protein